MVRNDPIVEEIHSVREAIARASNYDMDKMFEAARARQATEGRTIVTHSPKKPGPAKKAS